MAEIKEPGKRNYIRRLLVVYDVLFFYIIAAVFYFFRMYQKTRFIVALGYVSALLVFLLLSRFAFDVYKQVWRHASIGAYARLILADVLGGGIFVAASFIINRLYGVGDYKPFPDVFTNIALVLGDLIIITVVRQFYYYFYSYAVSNKNDRAKRIRKILETVGLVDFESEDAAGVLKIMLESESERSEPINEILAIFYQFAIVGKVVNVTHNKSGYINRTYKIETISERNHSHYYILQRINSNVFKDVDMLMDNFVKVTRFLTDKRKGGDTSVCRVADVKMTRNGQSYLKDSTGYWRVITCFDNAYSLDIPDSPDSFYNAGRAFGNFIKSMSDFDSESIGEVIPNFHNTQSRYEDLIKVINEDPRGRVSEVGEEISFVHEHKYLYDIISSKLESGAIPKRVCHNDTNLNNILFDKDTREVIAIIDLDTVMPSSPLYDFGDSMRIGTNTAKDDEKDLSKVSCDINLYEKYARGWLESCGSILTEEELNLLPYAALVITSEDGIRFLTDFINGDTYYNIYYPGQNLDRARTQFALLADMERKLPQIKEILRTIYAELGLKANIE